jgi:hypothetical protein
MVARLPTETGGASAAGDVPSSAGVAEGVAVGVADGLATGLADDAAEPLSGWAGVGAGEDGAGLDIAGAGDPLSITRPTINPAVSAITAAIAATEATPPPTRRPDRTEPPRMPAYLISCHLVGLVAHPGQ